MKKNVNKIESHDKVLPIPLSVEANIKTRHKI